MLNVSPTSSPVAVNVKVRSPPSVTVASDTDTVTAGRSLSVIVPSTVPFQHELHNSTEPSDFLLMPPSPSGEWFLCSNFVSFSLEGL